MNKIVGAAVVITVFLVCSAPLFGSPGWGKRKYFIYANYGDTPVVCRAATVTFGVPFEHPADSSCLLSTKLYGKENVELAIIPAHSFLVKTILVGMDAAHPIQGGVIYTNYLGRRDRAGSRMLVGHELDNGIPQALCEKFHEIHDSLRVPLNDDFRHPLYNEAAIFKVQNSPEGRAMVLWTEPVGQYLYAKVDDAISFLSAEGLTQDTETSEDIYFYADTIAQEKAVYQDADDALMENFIRKLN